MSILSPKPNHIIGKTIRLTLIYGDLFVSVFGFIGSCASILLLNRQRYRSIPRAVFMLAGAVFECIPLCFALLGYRVMNQILQRDGTAFSVYVCKLRLYLVSSSCQFPYT